MVLTQAIQPEDLLYEPGGANNLTVTSDGNTGVGIEAPVAKLHIHSGSSNTALRLQADGSPSLQFYSGTSSVGSIQASTSNLRMIAPGDYVNVNDVLYADAGSNRVGIGTNSPTEKLDVQGNAYVSGNINVNDAYVAGDLEINGQINGNVQLNDTLYGPTILCNRVSAAGGAFGTSASTGSLGYLAVGYDVLTNADGACIIADGTTAFMNNGTPNRMLMRFNQGYRLYTKGDLSVGVYMNQGDNSWSSTSDSTKKENFLYAEGNAFLQKITGMKLGSWNYKTQDKKLFRHYGPMAQEFYSNFGHDGIGEIGNDTTIATADIDGVMMIALQALIKEKETLKNNYEKQALEINKLKDNEKNLLQRLEKMEAMLSKNPAITTN